MKPRTRTGRIRSSASSAVRRGSTSRGLHHGEDAGPHHLRQSIPSRHHQSEVRRKCAGICAAALGDRGFSSGNRRFVRFLSPPLSSRPPGLPWPRRAVFFGGLLPPFTPAGLSMAPEGCFFARPTAAASPQAWTRGRSSLERRRGGSSASRGSLTVREDAEGSRPMTACSPRAASGSSGRVRPASTSGGDVRGVRGSR